MPRQQASGWRRPRLPRLKAPPPLPQEVGEVGERAVPHLSAPPHSNVSTQQLWCPRGESSHPIIVSSTNQLPILRSNASWHQPLLLALAHCSERRLPAVLTAIMVVIIAILVVAIEVEEPSSPRQQQPLLLQALLLLPALRATPPDRL